MKWHSEVGWARGCRDVLFSISAGDVDSKLLIFTDTFWGWINEGNGEFGAVWCGAQVPERP